MTPRQEEALRRLEGSTDVVYDLETSGLSWVNNHVVGHVLSFGAAPQDSYYLPFRHAGGGNIEGCSVPSTKDGWDGTVHPIEKEIVRLMDRQGMSITMHNASFDMKHAYRLGHNKWDANYYDTMLNAVLLNEWSPSFSLENLAKNAGIQQKKTTIYDYLISKFPEIAAAPKQAMGHYWRLAGDDPQAVEYAEADGAVTWQLRDWQMPQIAEQELTRVHDIESRLIPVLVRMTTRGVKIDIERLHEIKKIVENKRDEAMAKLPEGFNSKAPTQVRALMEKHGFTNWPMTEPSKAHANGQPSFPESWLLTNPIGQQIVAVRKYTNLGSSFIEPMLTTHLHNGRVHSDYNQLRGDEYGTITGRLSSSNPNAQQIPKRNKELGRLFRSIYVPDEGETWGSADYKQMEPTLLAYYSRSKVLLDGYRNNPDFDAHQGVADAAGIDRETGKRVNQTIITGGGKKVLIVRYGVTPEKAQETWDKFFAAMPEVKALQERATNVMRTRGYVTSVLGRRLRLHDRNKAYVAVNRLLQGSNADCLKQKLVEMDGYLKSEGRNVNILGNVHDAIDFSFGSGEGERKYRLLLEMMTSFGPGDEISLDVPVKVDAKEGANWSDATWGPE